MVQCSFCTAESVHYDGHYCYCEKCKKEADEHKPDFEDEDPNGETAWKGGVASCHKCCWFCDGKCIKENPNCELEFYPKKMEGEK